MENRKIKILVNGLKEIKHPKEIIDYYRGKIKKDHIFETKNGFKINIRYNDNLSDFLIFCDVWLYDVYLRKFNLPINPTIVDIGTNCGMFTLKCFQKLENPTIYGAEPSIENFEALESNLTMNNISTTNMFNFAISAKSGEALLYGEGKSYGSFSLHTKKGESTKVKTVGINEFLASIKENPINLMKIDCEGAEYEIIESLDVDRFFIENIVLEYHKISDNLDRKKMISLLKKKGLEIFDEICSTDSQGVFYCKKRK